MAKSTRVFVVSQPSLHSMVKGVYSNGTDFFNSVKNIENVELIKFKDVLGYENKKFNYNNIKKLLNVLHINDCFILKLYMKDDTVCILEVAIKMTNSKIDI